MKVSPKVLPRIYSEQLKVKPSKISSSQSILKLKYISMDELLRIAKNGFEKLKQRFKYSRGNFIDLYV